MSFKGDKDDKSYSSKTKQHVEKHKKPTITFTVRNGCLLHCMGDKRAVNIVRGAGRSFDLHELMKSIVETDAEDYEFDEYCIPVFPKLKPRYKSRKWDVHAATNNLKIYFNILGFGYGGWRKYGNIEDKPDFFPISLSWKRFTASRATIDEANMVLENLLHHFGYDIYAHFEHFEEPNAEVQPRGVGDVRVQPPREQDDGEQQDGAVQDGVEDELELGELPLSQQSNHSASTASSGIVTFNKKRRTMCDTSAAGPSEEDTEVESDEDAENQISLHEEKTDSEFSFEEWHS